MSIFNCMATNLIYWLRDTSCTKGMRAISTNQPPVSGDWVIDSAWRVIRPSDRSALVRGYFLWKRSKGDTRRKCAQAMCYFRPWKSRRAISLIPRTMKALFTCSILLVSFYVSRRLYSSFVREEQLDEFTWRLGFTTPVTCINISHAWGRTIYPWYFANQYVRLIFFRIFFSGA